MAPSAVISPQELPDASRKEVDFPESSFFNINGAIQRLPTPAEVRSLAPTHNADHPPPVVFESLSLLVKYGPSVTIAEAQCLWIIKKRLCGKVPVPEVYGWRVDGNDVFIYMQLVQGRRLKECWDGFGVEAKTGICDQLRQIGISLHDLKQDPRDTFIGACVSRKMWI
jgi:hypothetical protein